MPVSIASSEASHNPAASSIGFALAEQLVRAQPRQILGVEPVELLRIEHRVAAADAVERERLDQLVARHHFAIVAGRPSQQAEKIHHGVGKVSEPLVFGHRRRAMSLAEALLVGSENERHVRELRRRFAERLPEEHVLRRVRDVIVAADDVRDAHVQIVGDDRQVIGRQARSTGE